MLIKFSDNPIQKTIGVLYYSRYSLLTFALVAVLAVLQFKMHEWYGWWMLMLPPVPVTIMGGALAIFLGFRNNSAYDRWWEARKIWGGIVNYSRSFGMLTMAFGSGRHSEGEQDPEKVLNWKREMIRRHIAWLYALGMHLRKQYNWDRLDDYISQEDMDEIMKDANKPVQLINIQGQRLQEAYDEGMLDDFRHMKMTDMLIEFYNLQGKAERIKNTVFPYYYTYFTRLFLKLFLLCLPFILVETMGWSAIPMSIAISFVFSILEKSGMMTEDPFEGRASDTPIQTICRGIEIDMLEMLGDKNIPMPESSLKGRFGVEYLP